MHKVGMNSKVCNAQAALTIAMYHTANLVEFHKSYSRKMKDFFNMNVLSPFDVMVVLPIHAVLNQKQRNPLSWLPCSALIHES